MTILYSRTSIKRLARLEKRVRAAIVAAIDNPPDRGDIKKMRGRSIEDLYRLRIGKYRVLYVRTRETIKVLDIDTRADIYK